MAHNALPTAAPAALDKTEISTTPDTLIPGSYRKRYVPRSCGGRGLYPFIPEPPHVSRCEYQPSANAVRSWRNKRSEDSLAPPAISTKIPGWPTNPCLDLIRAWIDAGAACP